MTFYNTLETFSFSGTYYLNFFTFSENVYSNGIAEIFFERIITEFCYKALGSAVRLSEVIFFSFVGALFFLVAECYLDCIIPV